MTSAQASLEKVQADLSGLVEYNRDYEAVREQYSQYFNDYLNEDEAVLRDRLDVLTLLEECVMNQADLSSISIQGNICRISITDVPLNTISGIVADLESNPQVQYISAVSYTHLQCTVIPLDDVLKACGLVERLNCLALCKKYGTEPKPLRPMN